MYQREDLAELRERIDRIDHQIMDLVGQRLQVAREIGKAKGDGPIYDPRREAEVLADRLKRHGHLGEGLVRALMTELMGASRKVQGGLTLAAMGPEWSHSHEAALRAFGSSEEILFVKDPRRGVESLISGAADLAVLPVENSIEGVVYPTLDALLSAKSVVRIVREVRMRIEHCLAFGGEDMGTIRRVYSHPQALGQCEEWLARNLPQAELVEVSSTSEGARRALEEGQGAVCGARCAAALGFKTVIRSIQDSPNNKTRFLVLSTNGTSGGDRTTLVFTLPHRPGTLCDALSALADQGVNLLMIQSRPIPQNPFEYAFFADIEGDASAPPLSQALGRLKERTASLTVLGSYRFEEI